MGLIEKNGALAEANVYDGYGKVHIWDYSPGDFDRDGDVDTTDQGTMAVALINGGANKSTPDPSTDFDGDGDTDSADLTAFNVYKNAGGAVTEAFVRSRRNAMIKSGVLLTLVFVSMLGIHRGAMLYCRADGEYTAKWVWPVYYGENATNGETSAASMLARKLSGKEVYVHQLRENPTCCFWVAVGRWTPNPGVDHYLIIVQEGGAILTATNAAQADLGINALMDLAKRDVDGIKLPIGVVTNLPLRKK